jgi:hypothetical protein
MSLSDATLLGLELVAGGFTLSEFSARGISMTMAPIDSSAQILRDVNGNLVNLTEGMSQFQKYKFGMSCSDMESPGFAEVSSARDAIWPGAKFYLTCLPSLGAEEAITVTAMVMTPGWQVTRDEWGAVTSWSMDLEQV